MISVLYVDDERDLLDIAELFLEESGEFQVETSTSAKEVLASGSIHEYEAIIADYQMPGMDGIAFLKAVRAQNADIPFILFTGRGREEVVIEAINNGADFYLHKGGDPEAQFAELAHKIRQAVKRKRAEGSLHDSERRLADIIDFLPDATFAIDRSGHVIAWNRAMKEMTGVPAQEMLGKGDYCYAIPFYGTPRPILIDMVFSPHDEVRQCYSFVRVDRGILSAETINATTGGKPRILSGKAAPLSDSHGSVVGAIESIRDVTELKTTEQELRREEERYRHLYRYALVGLFETRLRDATIVACNQKYCDLAGFPSVEDAMGKDVIHLYKNPGDRTEVSRILHEQGSITDHEIQCVNQQTGRVFWAQFSARINRETDVAEGTIIDITERKRLESALEIEQGELKESCDQLTAARQELREQFNRLAESERTLRMNEERLVMAQDIGHTGSWEYNLATNRIWGSAEGLKIFGFPPVAGNIPVTDIEACISDREHVHQALVDLITEGKEYDLEYLIHPADGSALKIIHSIGRLQRDAAGNPLRVIGVIQDITERKRAEEEITFKNVILSTQQETSLDGILIVDENANILSYNQKFVAIWGIPDDLLLSRQDDPVLQYVEAQLADPEAFIARVRYLYEHREERSFEELHLRDRRILERFSAPILGETGKYYGRVWYFRDITGRKRAEELLRESEGRFRRLAENAPAMIYRMALPAGTYEYVSPASLVLTGYTPEEFYADPSLIVKLIHPGWRKYLQEMMEALLNGDAPPLYEFQIINRSGTTRWINQRNFLVTGEHGQPVAIEGIVTDITRQKETEHELQRMQQRALAVSANAGFWIWETDPEGMYRYSSPAVEQILGYQPDELTGTMHFYDLFDPPVREELKRVALAAFGSHEPFRAFMNPNRHKDGTLVLLSTSGMPVFDDDGTFSGYYGVDEDITERRQAEEALRESEEKYRLLADNVHDVIWTADMNMHLTYISPSVTALRGLTVEEALHESFADALTPESGRVLSESRERTLESLKNGVVIPPAQVMDLEFRRRDGTTVWTEVEISPAFDRNRNPAGVVGVTRDITWRREVEEALRESEEKFRSIVENANEIVFSVSPDGTFTYISPKLTELLGYPPGEVIGRSAAEFIHPDDFPRNRELFLQAVREGKTTTGLEYRIRHRNGTWQWYSQSISPLHDAGGEVIAVRGICHDISERKRAEEALRLANRQLSLLSSITRHDINNKITVILGYIGIVKKRFSNPDAGEYFSKIESATQNIRDHIEFTQVYQDIGHQEPQWIDLDAVLPRSQVPGSITLNSGVHGVEIFASPMLEKVFYNLLDNSIRHGQRVTEIRVSYRNEGEVLVVIWEDNGIGIPAEEKDLIFERGFGKNTGLGMFLVREILSLTDLTITETGVPQAGARFEIQVPADRFRFAA